MLVYCYLLECADGSYYCGWTKDLEKRVAAHQKGKGARYTRMKAPVKLAYYETVEDRPAALKREMQIKAMTHTRKRALAERYSRDAALCGMINSGD